jgi:glutamate 5-kinase
MKNKIVIKIGTNVLSDDSGRIDYNVMESLVNEITKIKKQGKDILLVTSGAIGAGMAELNILKRPEDVKMQQACAAVGQSILISKYRQFFNKYNIKVAQILLTYDDLLDKNTEINLGNSIDSLLKLNTIPIINENDPISINELGPSFGDNDNLSAIVAKEVKAEMLILLTVTDGLYDKDPKSKDAKIIREVKKFDNKITNLDGKSVLGVGGIKTKIAAAKLATESGILTIMANGKRKNTLIELFEGKKLGTVFYPKQKQ